jgi:hypothetical protein
MGCSDFNSCAGVKLLDGTTYVCEIQLNHIDMLAAKKEAHVYYEMVNEELPSLSAAVEAKSRPRRRPLIVRLHARPAPRERGENGSTRSRPAWARCAPSSSSAPFPRVRGEAPLRADCGSARADHGVNGGGAPSMGRQAAEETTALLFLGRDGEFHVFRKTIIDWKNGRDHRRQLGRRAIGGVQGAAQGRARDARRGVHRVAPHRDTTQWRCAGRNGERNGCDTAFCTSVAPMARARKFPSLPKPPTCMRPTSHFSVNASIEAFSRVWLRTTSSCERGVDGVDLTDATEMRQFVG